MKMERCVVRFAEGKDYDAVERIMKQVHALHVQWRPDVFCMPETVLPRNIFDEAQSAKRLLVAETDDGVIGMLLFDMRYIGGCGRVRSDMLWADAIGVDEGHRGQGVGHMLLDRMKEIARERGVSSIGLGVHACNDRARQMYEAYGFGERTIHMEMKI